MRVTVICGMVPPSNAPEGVTTVMLAGYLARAGCDVTIVTDRAYAAGLPERWRDPLVKFKPVVDGWGWGGWRSLRRALVETRPDAVLLLYLGYLHARHPMVTFLPTMCRRLNPRPRVLVEFSNIQGAEPKQWSTRLGRKLAEWWAGGKDIEWRFGTLLRDADAVAAYCREHLKYLASVYPPVHGKSDVLAATPPLNIVDDADGSVRRAKRGQMGVADGDFVVSYFGYIYPSKGLETLIEAVALAAPRVPGLRLVLVGGTPEAISVKDPEYPQRLRALPERLGFAGQVTWTGFCDDEVASAYLHASDACALPFVQGVRLNNTTFAVAAGHGLPVISTRGETLEPEFVDGRNVVLCWASDPAAMAEAIVRVAGDPALRRTLREGSLEFARGRSSWEAVTCQRLALLGGPGRAAPDAAAAAAAPPAPGLRPGPAAGI